MLVDAETFLGFNFIHFYFVFNVSDNGYILSLLGYEAFSFPFKGPRIHYKYPKKKKKKIMANLVLQRNPRIYGGTSMSKKG